MSSAPSSRSLRSESLYFKLAKLVWRNLAWICSISAEVKASAPRLTA